MLGIGWAERGRSVGRAIIAGERIAKRRRIGPDSNKRDRSASCCPHYRTRRRSADERICRAGNVRTSRRRWRRIRQVEGRSRRQSEEIGTILKECVTSLGGSGQNRALRQIEQIEARLGIARINIASS